MLLLDRALRDRDELPHVMGSCVPEVHQDVGVYVRDLRIADSISLESALIDEPARPDAFNLLEDGTGAGMPVEPWVLPPSPAQILLHDAMQCCWIASRQAEGHGEDDVAPVMKNAVIVTKLYVVSSDRSSLVFLAEYLA